MLFKGIWKEHLGNWANAQMQAEKDIAWWVDVIGVDPVRAGEVTLFRLLKWGGQRFSINIMSNYSTCVVTLCLEQFCIRQL
jgi:hypothetical protein